MDQDITVTGQPEDAQLTPADPTTAVAAEALTLAELEQATGKKFPSKDAALKSIQDTNSFVGKRKEDIITEVKASLKSEQDTSEIRSELAKLRKDMWYKDNPDYAPHRDLIEKLGDNPSEVVGTDSFKSVFEKVKGFDQSQKLKTVLDSNPRIAVSRDSLAKAREAQKAGNSEEAKQSVAQAVRAAYDF